MNDIRTLEGDLVARDMRIAIVAARFNEFVVESLIKGAVDCLRRHGASNSDLELVRVPGSYEMPLAVSRVAASRRFDEPSSSGTTRPCPSAAATHRHVSATAPERA